MSMSFWALLVLKVFTLNLAGWIFVSRWLTLTGSASESVCRLRLGCVERQVPGALDSSIRRFRMGEPAAKSRRPFLWARTIFFQIFQRFH